MRKVLILLTLVMISMRSPASPFFSTIFNTPLQASLNLHLEVQRPKQIKWTIDPSFPTTSKITPPSWSGLMNDGTVLTFKITIHL